MNLFLYISGISCIENDYSIHNQNNFSFVGGIIIIMYRKWKIFCNNKDKQCKKYCLQICLENLWYKTVNYKRVNKSFLTQLFCHHLHNFLDGKIEIFTFHWAGINSILGTVKEVEIIYLWHQQFKHKSEILFKHG